MTHTTARCTTVLNPAVAGVQSTSNPVRNGIITALMSSGNADFFSVSSLTLTLECDTTPFSYNVAGTTYTISADKTLAVTDDAHNFIYIDAAGAMGRSATPCTYAFSAPGGPASGDYWFDLGADQMKTYNGSAWVASNVIFIGYVLAASGSINARYACEPVQLTPMDRFTEFGDGAESTKTQIIRVRWGKANWRRVVVLLLQAVDEFFAGRVECVCYWTCRLQMKWDIYE